MGTVNMVSLIIYLVIIAFALFLHSKNDNVSFSQINLSDVTFSKILTIILPAAIILIGATIRIYKLAHIPEGLHQDEASIGYEAYILSAFGIDRDGNRYPIYPITYGSGGGSPLMIYINAVTTFLFGSSPATLRALPAFLGVLTLVIFFFLMKMLSNESFQNSSEVLTLQYVSGEHIWLPLVCLCIIALSPWHIMLSRWSLDSNTTPFWVLSAMFLFIVASRKQKEATSFEDIGTLFKRKDRKKSRTLSASDRGATLLFALSAFFYALTLYSYGAATIVIPIHLILMCLIFTKEHRMTSFQVFVGVMVFIICVAPLMIFYLVNAFNLPQITTPFFTITKFTAKRSVFASGAGILLSVVQNFIIIIKNLTIGASSEQILNYIPGFPPLFAFTFPITILGLVISILRVRQGEITDRIIGSFFVPAFLFGLFVEEDITRMVLIFIPMVYYMARGFIFVVNEFVTLEKSTSRTVIRIAAIFTKAVVPALFFIGAFFFSRTYFTDFNSLSADAYMPGYGEACAYADSRVSSENVIYSTYEHVSAPFMVALYYTKTPPRDFISTVHYKDPDAEFRIANSFTHFRFGLPEDMADNALDYLENGDVFILHNSELSTINNAPGYDPEAFDEKAFGDFSVITPRS